MFFSMWDAGNPSILISIKCRKVKIGGGGVAPQKALSHREAVLPLFDGVFPPGANFAYMFDKIGIKEL